MAYVVHVLELEKIKRNKVAFSYEINKQKRIVIISLKGFVLEESSMEEFFGEVDKYFDEEPTYFVVDLKEITHMNSSGLNLLIRLLTKCRNNKGDMVICNLPKKVENLLIVSKLASIFEVADSLGAAKERLSKKDIV